MVAKNQFVLMANRQYYFLNVNVANDVTNTSVSQAVNASAYLFQDTYKRMEKLVVRRSQDALM